MAAAEAPPPPSASSSSSAAARPAPAGAASLETYLGSVISLTLKSEIRYEGVLYNINKEESSIVLRNVRSFGTEGRKKDGVQIPASDKIYKDILFQQSDIKDLQVKSSAPPPPPPPQPAPLHNDPATIQSHYPPPASTSSLPSAGGPALPDLSSLPAQYGFQRPSFQSNIPLYQPGNTPWGSSGPPPTGNVSALSVPPMYWQGHYAPPGSLPQHLQQPPLLQSTPELSAPQAFQYPGLNPSLPSGPQKLSELQPPLLQPSVTAQGPLTSIMPATTTPSEPHGEPLLLDPSTRAAPEENEPTLPLTKQIPKKALEFLRKRYRLPMSIIVHAIPPDYLSAWEESDDRITGLVASIQDGVWLMERSKSCSSREIQFRYAEFVSLQCVEQVNAFISGWPQNVHVLNPHVAKEKLRLYNVLRSHCDKLMEAVAKVQSGENLQGMMVLRCQLSHDSERSTCIIESLLRMKIEALDRLLLLVFAQDSSTDTDLAEGLWILQHHRPFDYNMAVHPDDGAISWPAIVNIQCNIRKKLGSRLPTDDTIVKVRSHLLSVFGRHHLESKLQQVFEKTRAALQQYMVDPTAKSEAILAINAQIEVLRRLMRKSSLIGCQPIIVPGEEPIGLDLEGEGDGNTAQDGQAQHLSDGDSSGSSNVHLESPISSNSIVSTDPELCNSDDSEKKVACIANGQNVNPAAMPAVEEHTAELRAFYADMEEVTDEEDECDEPGGAMMRFEEIEGEPHYARSKRYAAYWASLDYCL